MQVRVTVSLGLVGCRREVIVDIDDDVLRKSDLSEGELVEEYAKDALWEMIDWGFEVVDGPGEI